MLMRAHRAVDTEVGSTQEVLAKSSIEDDERPANLA